MDSLTRPAINSQQNWTRETHLHLPDANLESGERKISRINDVMITHAPEKSASQKVQPITRSKIENQKGGNQGSKGILPVHFSARRHRPRDHLPHHRRRCVGAICPVGWYADVGRPMSVANSTGSRNVDVRRVELRNRPVFSREAGAVWSAARDVCGRTGGLGPGTDGCWAVLGSAVAEDDGRPSERGARSR